MLEGYDWPNNIAVCVDCGRRFCCLPCCEEAGVCPKCKGVLCSTCHMEAVHERFAICATCAVPRQSDDDLAPKKEAGWQRWTDTNDRRIKL